MPSTNFQLYAGDSDSDPDSDSGISYEVEHLSRDNYFLWASDMRHVLQSESQNLWHIVSGTESPPPPTTPPI